MLSPRSLLHIGHLFKTWRKRWFQLDGPILKYYQAADEGADVPRDLQLKGVVEVSGCTVEKLQSSEAFGRSCAFQLSPMGKEKTFFICASSPGERDMWMSALVRSSKVPPPAKAAARTQMGQSFGACLPAEAPLLPPPPPPRHAPSQRHTPATARYAHLAAQRAHGCQLLSPQAALVTKYACGVSQHSIAAAAQCARRRRGGPQDGQCLHAGRQDTR